MKKSYALLILLVFTLFNASATSYTSAQNGNWNDIMTWSPWGIPNVDDTVLINHNVTINTAIYFVSGSITVSTNGVLDEDSPTRYIALDGPSVTFTNNGTTTVNTISNMDGFVINTGDLNVKIIDVSEQLDNSGNMNAVDSLRNNGTINNNGTISIRTFLNNDILNNYGTIQGLTTVVDSMYNTGAFLNDIGAILKADSCTNSGTFTNNGIVNFNQHTNYGTLTNTNYFSFDNMTNVGTFTNQDSLIGSGSITNTGTFNNQTGALFNLNVSLLNSHPGASVALFNNDGAFNIGDSYYNFDNVTGNITGSITVQDTSYNSGNMSGSFDFCDATPPGGSPFIDFNLGTIDPTITYCTTTGVKSTEISTLIAYPNPTKGIVNLGQQNVFIEVYNIEGKKVINDYDNQVNLERFNSGIYYLVLKDQKGHQLYKEKLIKE